MTSPEQPIVQRELPEISIGAHARLGRHVHHDERSREFPAEATSKIKSVRHMPGAGVQLPLDQGQLGSCTANALCGAIQLNPDFKAGSTYDEAAAQRLYGLETSMEGEPWPPNDPGGSGLMVCKAAKKLSWIKQYRHAFGLEHSLAALALRPAIFGVTWYDSMFSPGADGLLVVDRESNIAGGHEICADEVDTVNQTVGFWNSWGPSWGVGGRFYVRWRDLDMLLQDDGDCTVPS